MNGSSHEWKNGISEWWEPQGSLCWGGTTRNRLGVPCFDHLQKWVRQGEMGSEGSHRGSPETPVIATTVAVKINTQMFYSIKKRV